VSGFGLAYLKILLNEANNMINRGIIKPVDLNNETKKSDTMIFEQRKSHG
jgi:hypothetical protein